MKTECAQSKDIELKLNIKIQREETKNEWTTTKKKEKSNKIKKDRKANTKKDT